MIRLCDGHCRHRSTDSTTNVHLRVSVSGGPSQWHLDNCVVVVTIEFETRQLGIDHKRRRISIQLCRRLQGLAVFEAKQFKGYRASFALLFTRHSYGRRSFAANVSYVYSPVDKIATSFNVVRLQFVCLPEISKLLCVLK